MSSVKGHVRAVGVKALTTNNQVLLIGMQNHIYDTVLTGCKILGQEHETVDFRHLTEAPLVANQDQKSDPHAIVLRFKDATTLEQLSTLRVLWRHTPIIVAVNDDELSNIPQLLAKGASDFVLLPLDMTEFHRRVAAWVGCFYQRSRESTRSIGDLTVNLIQRTVSNGTESVTLTPIESRIVAAFADARGNVVERQEMKQMCWGDLSITDNALNRKIYEVRRTLRRLSDGINIRTIYGHGFEIEVQAGKSA